jgi:hypothetical protein
MSSPPRFATSAHGQDRTDWIEAKNGYTQAPSLAPSDRAESFGASVICSDCQLESIPCACCLDCGRVQDHVMDRGEICGECMARPEHDEADSVNALGMSGMVSP